MLRLLFYTALRVSELCRIQTADVDLAENKIFINHGQGAKDRYVLFPDSFSLMLQTYIAGKERNRYLFETRLHTHSSPRMVQMIVQRYAAKAELEAHVHPHVRRHQMPTFLTAEGKLTDAQIQLISGHSSQKSLERYQHMGLGDVAEDYQEAVKKVRV